CDFSKVVISLVLAECVLRPAPVFFGGQCGSGRRCKVSRPGFQDPSAQAAGRSASTCKMATSRGFCRSCAGLDCIPSGGRWLVSNFTARTTGGDEPVRDGISVAGTSTGTRDLRPAPQPGNRFCARLPNVERLDFFSASRSGVRRQAIVPYGGLQPCNLRPDAWRGLRASERTAR